MRAIFENIKHAFGALWGFRARGESFEVITPFPTSTDMYVSVFITVRDGVMSLRMADGWTRAFTTVVCRRKITYIIESLRSLKKIIA